MNRRNFISTLTGAAGAGLILWRVPKPVIFLPSTEIVTVDWLASIGPFIEGGPWRDLDSLNTDIQDAIIETIARGSRLPIRYIKTYKEAYEFFGLEDA